MAEPSKERERITPRWVKSGKWLEVAYYQGCCDCGLVHRVEYRAINGRLENRVFRAPRITARARKQFKFAFKPKGKG